MSTPSPDAASTSSTKRYWLCPNQACGYRNETPKRKCIMCGRHKRKKPVRAHKKALRDNAYPVYEALNAEVHGPAFGGEWHPSYCGVCGKPPVKQKHDRDHDHKTALPRGLACGGNQGCNILMVPWVTAATARGIALAKQEAAEPDAERWVMLSAYLERVEAYRGLQEHTE